MKNSVNRYKPPEIEVIKGIAASGSDGPVTMLNINKYSEDAGFPDGSLYRGYITVLSDLLPNVGVRILWRSPVFGQAVGSGEADEIFAAWYPSHQAFLDLPSVPGGKNNFRLRKLCVERAVIHRCDGVLGANRDD